MKKVVKEQWVKALRSGRYKKTKGALKNTKGYCCLGVLTNLYIKENGGGKWKKVGKVGDDLVFIDDKGNPERSMLPGVVAKWSGLKALPGSPNNLRNPKLKNPVNVKGGVYSDLVGLNDDTSVDFKFIADVIEKQF